MPADINILLLIVLAIIVISAIRGFVLGFLRLLYSLVSWVVLLIVFSKLIDAIGGFIIAFILAIIVVKIIGFALKIVDHIPLVKGFNRWAGLFGGIFLGYMIVELMMLIISVLSWTQLGVLCIGYIDDSQILTALYDNNAITTIINALQST